MLRHARTPRPGLTALLGAALTAASAGCTHNYYYGAAPDGCAPATVVTTPGVASSGVAYGSICDVPSQVVNGGTVIASNPANTPRALGGPRPPRVVLSDTPNSSRLAWRRADPDGGVATTRVEGAVDEPTVTK